MNKNEFKIIKSNNDTLLNDFSHLNNSELIRQILIWKRLDSLLEWKDKKTILDVFNTRWLNNLEIEQMIKENISIDINSEQWITTLNQYFHLVIDFLKDTLYKNVWNNILKDKEYFFKNKKDIISFLRETEKWKRKSKIYCRIAKTTYIINEILGNEELSKSIKNTEKIIKENILPLIKVYDIKMLLEQKESKCCVLINNKKYNFILKYRWKNDISSFLKLWYNPEYSTWDMIKDNIWIELICENKKDIWILINYFYTMLFNEKINELKEKNIDLNIILNNPNIGYKLKKEIQNIDSILKDEVHKWYMDIKIIWLINKLKVEFRITLKWNKQENPLKSDEIYYLKKILSFIIRTDWYITSNYIKIVINEFFKKNLKCNNILTKEQIFKYLTESLVEINKKTKSKIYTTKNRYISMDDTEFYPKNFKKII